jgi:ABC-type antimicrobial peptide transport system permease subunit
VAASVRQTLHGLAPGLPVYDVMTMQESLGGGNGYFLVKLGAVLATMLGVLGAVLALVGLYGVVAYAASQRTHEIGIRVALGAGRRQIVGMVAGHGLGLSLVGGAVGLVAALAGSRLIAWMLFSVTPYDPLTYVGVCVLLAGVALVACVVPATRALRVDPSVALRCE